MRGFTTFLIVKESKLEMLIFMDLDSVNFRAFQCGYNDVSDGNLTYTYSSINHSGKELSQPNELQ